MLKDLVKQSRSYRSFDPAVKITQEQLLEFADAARLTPSTTNLQAIKFKLVSDPAQVESLVERTTLAAALRPLVLPPKGHHPAAFIVVCIDTAIAKNPTPFLKDVGIAAQTILLCAAEQGLGAVWWATSSRRPSGRRWALGRKSFPLCASAWASRMKRWYWRRCRTAKPPITGMKLGCTTCPSAA